MHIDEVERRFSNARIAALGAAGLSILNCYRVSQEVGYVANSVNIFLVSGIFGLFVSDFKYFADEIVQKGGHQNLYLIAHSMGGAIASLYLEQEGDKTPFQAVAFTSPMHDITAYSGHFIDISVRPICKVAERLAKNNPRGFTVDGGSYHPKPFKENKYTTSEIRYDRLVKLYSDKVYEEIRNKQTKIFDMP